MRRAGPGGLPGEILVIPLFHLPPRFADRIAKAVRRMIFGDLSEFGLPIPAEGPFTRARRLRVARPLVDPEVVAAVRSRAIEVVAAIAAAPVPVAGGLYFHGLLSRPSLIGYLGKQSLLLAKTIVGG